MKGIVNPSGYRIPNPQLNPVLEPLFCRKTLDQLLHSSQWALSCFRKLHISEIISDTPRWGVCIYIYIKSVWVCDYMQEIWRNTHRKTNMTMEKQQFEDVSPTENGDVPLTCWFSAGYHYLPCIWDCHQTCNLHNSTSHLWLLLGMPNCLNQNVSDFKHSNKVLLNPKYQTMTGTMATQFLKPLS